MTLTTTKGETFTSTLTDHEAAEVLTAKRQTSTFAMDLVKAYARGRLTERQRPWLHKLALEAAGTKQPEAPRESVAGLEPVRALLVRASEHLKFPKLTLDRDGRLLRLALAGAKSSAPGSVNVTDGRPYGQNTWYGRINADGTFNAGRAADGWVLDTLRRLAADPAGFAREYGKATGACCFCNQALSTADSLAVGYGPVCAEHYGLPWGEDIDEALDAL